MNIRTSKEPDLIDIDRESGNDGNLEHLCIECNEDKLINQYVWK